MSIASQSKSHENTYDNYENAHLMLPEALAPVSERATSARSLTDFHGDYNESDLQENDVSCAPVSALTSRYGSLSVNEYDVVEVHHVPSAGAPARIIELRSSLRSSEETSGSNS